MKNRNKIPAKKSESAQKHYSVDDKINTRSKSKTLKKEKAYPDTDFHHEHPFSENP
jgi:hypothetical protein